jgi:hypothetical protein
MNITGLKPYYQCDEHDKFNCFAATGEMNKGTLVAIGTAIGNTNVLQNTGVPPATPYQTVSTAFGGAPAYAYTVMGKVAATVKSAGPTDACIGMTLNDVKETNRFGENYRYRPTWDAAENDIVLIGQSVPVARRGTFYVDNIAGTAAAGSGFTASGGRFVPQVYSRSTSIGVFLTNEDADGYAMIALNCV